MTNFETVMKAEGKILEHMFNSEADSTERNNTLFFENTVKDGLKLMTASTYEVLVCVRQ